MRTWTAFCTAWALLAAATGVALVDETEPLAVGAKAPPVKLLDQNGKQQSLNELLKRGNVALVFYRSADW